MRVTFVATLFLLSIIAISAVHGTSIADRVRQRTGLSNFSPENAMLAQLEAQLKQAVASEAAQKAQSSSSPSQVLGVQGPSSSKGAVDPANAPSWVTFLQQQQEAYAQNAGSSKQGAAGAAAAAAASSSEQDVSVADSLKEMMLLQQQLSAKGAAHGGAASQVTRGKATTAKSKNTSAFTPCHTCVFVLERIKKGNNMLLPAICSEVWKEWPDAYSDCHQVLNALTYNGNNVRYWLFEGCFKYEVYRAKEWIKPCPSHVMCSVLKDLDGDPFCAALPMEDPFKKK